MTYDDYIRVFLLLRINNKDGKKNIVSRTAEIMQINCVEEDADFDLRKCTVGMCLVAEVKTGSGIVRREETYVI